jgi:glycosyltransferase involved in cell wall biosynthesis
MIIGIVTAWFPSGAGSVSKAYVEALSRNHEVFIYARGGYSMIGDNLWDIKCVHWAPYHPNGIRLNDLKGWITRNKIELLFFNEQRYWQPVLLAKRMGIPVGAYIDYYKQNTVDAFSIYDFLICNTQRHYSVFDWHEHCYYIPWGTDIEKYKPIETRADRPLTFIHIMGWQEMARIDRRGTIFVLSAFTKIKGDCRLLLYSQRALEKCLPIIQNYVRSDSRIIFVQGTFDPVPYTNGDVFVYPSRLDGIGLTLPEAIACGLPAITTDSPPMNEFVTNNENGYLIKVDKFLGRKDGYYWPESLINEDSLVEAMEEYFKPEVLNSHRLNARMKAINELNWKNNYKMINDIFSDSIHKKGPVTDELIKQLRDLDDEIAPKIKLRMKYLIYDLYRTVFNIRETY